MPLPIAVPIVGGVAALGLVAMRIRTMLKTRALEIAQGKIPAFPNQAVAQKAAKKASPTQTVESATAAAVKFIPPTEAISKVILPYAGQGGIKAPIAMQIYPGDLLQVDIAIAKLGIQGYPSGTFMMIATAPADMVAQTILAKPALPAFGTGIVPVPWTAIQQISPGDEIEP